MSAISESPDAKMTVLERTKRNAFFSLVFFLLLATVVTMMPKHESTASVEKLDTDFPLSRSLNQGSTVAASSAAVLAAGSKVEWASIMIKPVIIEVGALVLCQTVGLPFLSKLAFAMRRMPRFYAVTRNSLRLSEPLIKSLKLGMRKGVRLWNTMTVGYKKTSASKVVGHSKKIIKIFKNHNDDAEEE